MKKKTKVLAASVLASQAVLVAPAFAEETTSAPAAEGALKVAPFETTVEITAKNPNTKVELTQDKMTIKRDEAFNLAQYLKVAENGKLVYTIENLADMNITFFQEVHGELEEIDHSLSRSKPGHYYLGEYFEGGDYTVVISLNDSEVTATIVIEESPSTVIKLTGIKSAGKLNRLYVDVFVNMKANLNTNYLTIPLPMQLK